MPKTKNINVVFWLSLFETFMSRTLIPVCLKFYIYMIAYILAFVSYNIREGDSAKNFVRLLIDSIVSCRKQFSFHLWENSKFL